MSWVHQTMIVPATNVILARTITAGVGGDAGNNMFQTPLSPSGTGTATHYISAGLIESTFAALLTDANATYTACQKANVVASLADIQTLLNVSTIDTGEPFAIMAKLGLKLIQATL